MTNVFFSDKLSSEHATEMEDIKSLVHRLFVALHLEEHQIRKERELLQKLDHLKEELLPLEQVGKWCHFLYLNTQKHFLLSRVTPVIEKYQHGWLWCVWFVCYVHRVNSNIIHILFDSVLFPSCYAHAQSTTFGESCHEQVSVLLILGLKVHLVTCCSMSSEYPLHK